MKSRMQLQMTFAALAVLLVGACLTSPTWAKHDDVVTYATGVVEVERDGTVCVVVVKCEVDDEAVCKPGDVLVPSNAQGLFRAGQIEEEEVVRLKITTDRGKHRGHVTVLK